MKLADLANDERDELEVILARVVSDEVRELERERRSFERIARAALSVMRDALTDEEWAGFHEQLVDEDHVTLWSIAPESDAEPQEDEA